MAGIGEKLYPPIINGTLPAFYPDDDGTTARIVVPFSMNRAVSSNEIGGFSLKIKTVQSNTLLASLKCPTNNNNYDVQDVIARKMVTFILEDLQRIKIGQFLKIQLAYIQKDTGFIGYYSTVGIIKYTAKPNIYIENFGEIANRIETFRSSYTGVYEPKGDPSERPYSYNFSLYNQYNELIETSGWLLHNTSINNIASESLSLSKTTDTYTFNTQVIPDKEYYLQYSVRTINNLEVHSPLYTCLEPYINISEFETNLNAENNFEEGYVRVYLTYKDNPDKTSLSLSELQRQYEEYDITETENSYILQPKEGNNNESRTLNKFILTNPVSIEIYRTDGLENGWILMQKVYFTNYDYAINKWEFKDFTVEQGVTYQYCFRQYNERGIQSERVLSNIVVADFEDIFLWDGKKQIKIRFNPKVSSFKINRLEQKTDTIGNKFPFIFRNGQVEYKEFPISGLISYHLDNNELFIKAEDDLNITLGKYATRLKTPVNQQENDLKEGKSWEKSENLDSLWYNMQAERKFKLKLLDWLGNGEIKLFRSPAEGNYFVRLLNISLSPEDKLGRMLHNFSCTAYEMADFSYKNLLELGFLNPDEISKSELEIKTIKLKDLLQDIQDINSIIQINTHPIFEFIRIERSNSSNANQKLYMRLGSSINSKTEITFPVYTIFSKNQTLQNLYFCPSDILDENSIEGDTFEDQITQIFDLIGDTEITYKYYNSQVLVGEFNNIKDVYLTNVIETIVGPLEKSFAITTVENIQKETLKFYVLNFQEKAVIKVIKNGDIYKDKFGNVINQWDKLNIYEIYENTNFERIIELKYIDNNNILQTKTNDFNINKNITLITDEDEVFNLSFPPPAINLNSTFYKTIILGNGVYLDYACQNKITEYNN